MVVYGSLWSTQFSVLDGFDSGQATVKAQASWNNFNGYLAATYKNCGAHLQANISFDDRVKDLQAFK